MDCFLTDATDPAGSAVPAMSATPKAEKRRGVRMTSSPTRPMWASMSWGLQATGFVTRKRVAPLLTTRASMPQDVLVMHRIPRKLVVIGLAAAAALLLGGLPRAAHAAKLCSQCNSCDPCGTPCSTTPDGEPMSACAPPLCLPVGGLCSDICGGATPAGTPCSEQISETQCVASLCPEAPPPVTCATSDTGEVIHGAAGAIHYFHTDALDSTRMATDGDWGAANARYDYLPFGEEIPAGVNDRGNAPGSGYNLLSFDTRHKFTGKERDGESELDYFGARYYSAAQGRFTGPDTPLLDQRATDPQSWNLYAYVRNNPLGFVDTTGRYIVPVGRKGTESVRRFISMTLRSPTGRAMIERIAADPRPTFVSQGTLPLTRKPDGSRAVNTERVKILPGEVGKAGGTAVILDPRNASTVASAKGDTDFKAELTAFNHGMTHVDDANRASTFQDAYAAGMAGDAESHPGVGNTTGGSARANADTINGELGDSADSYRKDAAADERADAIIERGMRQFMSLAPRTLCWF